jgi:hypothetical protein
MADSFYTPQIDYRSRDYTAIRDDLIGLIPNFAPQWTSRDGSDFGIVLVELFAYMGDILNYYIDRAANESFLSTSTQRDTVLNIARLFNYTPNPPTEAQFNLTALNTLTSGSVTLKTGAQFATSPDTTGNQIYFEYLGSDVVIASSVSTTVTVKQGISTSVSYVSDGTPDQTFSLQPPVIPTTVSAVVSSTTYRITDNLIDYGPNDTVFSSFFDGNDVFYLRFGDGVFGKIPPNQAPIVISYRTGGGIVGNVGTGAINTVVSNKSVDATGLVVSNTGTAAVLGSDIESTDSIRINAPLSLKAMNRAVSISDYASLAVRVTDANVAKANAVAETYNSVILFVAGTAGGTFSDFTPIYNYFIGKTPPGTMLTIANYSTAYPAVTLSITVAPTASQTDTQSLAQAALRDLFSFDNVTFNDSISQSDVYKAIMSVPNVTSCFITALERRTSASPATTLKDSMTFYVNEVPIYNASCISVSASGGV